MYYINLMFLAMAAMIVFLSFALISNWILILKAKRRDRELSQSAPPLKRSVVGRVEAMRVLKEPNEATPPGQAPRYGIGRLPSIVTQRPLASRGDHVSEAQGFSQRLH